MVRIFDIYDTTESLGMLRVLYQLLAERPPEANISHRVMPSFDEHVAFVASRPYKAWYAIQYLHEGDAMPGGRAVVGATYLTRNDEVGLFILDQYKRQGYGTKALACLRCKHTGPLLANVSPGNEASLAFFAAQGFKPYQTTLRLAV